MINPYWNGQVPAQSLLPNLKSMTMPNPITPIVLRLHASLAGIAMPRLNRFRGSYQHVITYSFRPKWLERQPILNPTPYHAKNTIHCLIAHLSPTIICSYSILNLSH